MDPFFWMIAAFAVVGVATLWQLFLRGEAVGEMAAPREGGGEARVRVKRVADSKGVPTIMVQVSIALATSMRQMNAHDARRLAQMLEEGIEGDVEGCGIGRVRTDGGVLFLILNVDLDETRVRARLAATAARRLASMLRLAASPGRTLALARWNATRAKAPMNEPRGSR